MSPPLDAGASVFDPGTSGISGHFLDAGQYIAVSPPQSTIERESKFIAHAYDLSLLDRVHRSYSPSPFNGVGEVRKGLTTDNIVNPIFLADNIVHARKPLVSNHIDDSDLNIMKSGYQLRVRGRFYPKLAISSSDPNEVYGHGQWSLKSLPHMDERDLDATMDNRVEIESLAPQSILQCLNDFDEASSRMPKALITLNKMNRLSLGGFITPRACASLIVYVREYDTFVELRHEFDPSTQITANGSKAIRQDIEIEAEVYKLYIPHTSTFSEEQKEKICKQARLMFDQHIIERFSADITPTRHSKIERGLIASALDAYERHSKTPLSRDLLDKTKFLVDRYGRKVRRGTAILLKQSHSPCDMFNNLDELRAIAEKTPHPSSILPANNSRIVINGEKTANQVRCIRHRFPAAA